MEITKQQSDIWGKVPNNWKILGLFYYNKNDERIFPPKRIEWMGITTNFANLKSIMVLISVLALIIISVLIAEKCFK